jgi:hypothetical protein
LRQDLDDNAELYGKRLENRTIVHERRARAQGRHGLINLLNHYSVKGTDELVDLRRSPAVFTSSSCSGWRLACGYSTGWRRWSSC